MADAVRRIDFIILAPQKITYPCASDGCLKVNYKASQSMKIAADLQQGRQVLEKPSTMRESMAKGQALSVSEGAFT